jgi:hypothetical protein
MSLSNTAATSSVPICPYGYKEIYEDTGFGDIYPGLATFNWFVEGVMFRLVSGTGPSSPPTGEDLPDDPDTEPEFDEAEEAEEQPEFYYTEEEE